MLFFVNIFSFLCGPYILDHFCVSFTIKILNLIKDLLHILIVAIIFSFSSKISCQEINLKFKGKSKIEQQIIDSVAKKLKFKKKDDLSDYLNEIKKKLIRKGFITITEKQERNKNEFTIKLQLGPRYSYVYISGNYLLFEKIGFKAEKNKITGEMSTKIPVNILEETLNNLSNILSEESFTFSTVKLINIKPCNNNSLEADLQITKGGKRKIDKVKIVGYEKFPNLFIERFVGIKKNKAFNINEIHKKLEALSQLTFATQKRSAEAMFEKDSTTIFIYLEKNRSSNFDGFLGFGSDQKSGQIEFDGYVNLNLINNLNQGESFNLNYKSDEIDQKTLNVNLTIPYIFRSPLGTSIKLNIFKKDSTFTNAQQSIELFYQFDPNQKMGIEYSLERSNEVNDNNTNVDNFQSNFYNLNYNFLKLKKQDLLYQLNGSLNVSLGFGKRSSLIKTKQRQIKIKGNWLFELNKKNAFFVNTHMEDLKSDGYLYNELIRFGGITSIRGFEENSLFAKRMAVLCTEFRYRFSNNLFIHSVVDSGYFEDLFRTDHQIFGFGFGFGLQTNGGLMRLTYANGKIKNNPFNISNSKLHVSFTSNF